MFQYLWKCSHDSADIASNSGNSIINKEYESNYIKLGSLYEIANYKVEKTGIEKPSF